MQIYYAVSNGTFISAGSCREHIMKDIVSDPELVAYCGLYCGACGAFLKGRCPGCHENEKASWCKVRSCCMDNSYSSCAQCKEFDDPTACGKFNNIFSKIFGFIFRSDRAACIRQIRKLGIRGHADDMTRKGAQSIRR
jgi:hypothetical protein